MDAISLQPEFKFCAVALTKAPVELQADFTPQQKNYLRHFLADQPASTVNRFRLPVAAPFTQNQRVFINEALAKMLAGK